MKLEALENNLVLSQMRVVHATTTIAGSNEAIAVLQPSEVEVVVPIGTLEFKIPTSSLMVHDQIKIELPGSNHFNSTQLGQAVETLLTLQSKI
ncbi:UNKNOWN [Stylonychia lemnae]|uniref:Uncharacterized protein n=1 Tax=Stylonychia lemnae TaxID=5949 RepID=A0A078AYJ8_STYLE|nr:UNKNOWN [Stylonychia lemnae]|eukprot:CDW85863.1 UNKNOWN [Stylonychia lemnae]